MKLSPIFQLLPATLRFIASEISLLIPSRRRVEKANISIAVYVVKKGFLSHTCFVVACTDSPPVGSVSIETNTNHEVSS